MKQTRPHESISGRHENDEGKRTFVRDHFNRGAPHYDHIGRVVFWHGPVSSAAGAGANSKPSASTTTKKLKAEKSAAAPGQRNRSAVANKPSWENLIEGNKPFHHHQQPEE